ncbi:anti-sigma factor family protein [Brevibacillus ginsengisoli]|uniref:anti-sigma factor family protein n=1 Tax=Brevibacillus ginsengisoli TaxID=363854 RepID=UPI003CEE69DF
MNCPQWGLLQAYIDGEIERDERKEIALHLEQCQTCRQAMSELKRLEDWGQIAIEESFTASQHEIDIDVDAAWDRFTRSAQSHQETKRSPFPSLGAPAAINQSNQTVQQVTKRSWFHMTKSYTKWVSAAAAVAIVAGSFTIPSVQAAASNFLSIFRVDKTETIKLTNQDLEEINQWFAQGNDGSKELAGIGKLKAEGNRHKNYDSREAALKAGVSIPQAPKGYTVSHVEQDNDWTLTFELDTDKTNKLLKKLHSDVQFDSSLNGKEFSITIPEVVRTSFEQKNEQNSSHKSFVYTTSKSPTIKAPADVNLDELRETVLRLPFIPDNVKNQLANIEDWKQTLPIPYIEGTGKEVTIDGAKGIFAGDQHQAFMMWQKDGQLHSIEAWNSDQNSKPYDLKELTDMLKQIQP